MAAGAGATQTQKEPKNLVHQNAILCETVEKELRNQKLYVKYSMNPHKKCKDGRLWCTVVTIQYVLCSVHVDWKTKFTT